MKERSQQSSEKTADGQGSDSPSVEEVVGRLDRLWADQPPEVPSPFASLAGTQVGSYTIERVIGRGGFGIVYKARDHLLNRDVALKVPRPEVLLDEERLRRFEAEALATAHLDHSSIVPLYEADLAAAMPYLASAYCPGPNLQQWLENDEQAGNPGTDGVRIAGPKAARFLATLADAVHYAHERGVVHRDLKPSNILLMPVTTGGKTPDPLNNTDSLDDYQPRLTDFGLSRFAENAMTATRSSIRLGTPLYMSPEQATGKSELHGPASDIYSLGVLLYQLVSGHPPFGGSSEFEIVQQILTAEPTPPHQLSPGIPRDLSSICLKCLEKKPQRRYISAAALRDDLQRFLRGEPTVARPVTAVAKGVRWAKRAPAKAALLLLSLTATAATVAALSFHVRTVEQDATELAAALSEVQGERETARMASNDAEAARKVAETRRQFARETSYRSDMRLAFEFFERGQAQAVTVLLSNQLPGEDIDLRGPEWFVLQANLEARFRMIGHHDGAVMGCVLSSDHSKAWSTGLDGFVREWDLQTGEEVSRYHAKIGEVHALAVSPDGTTIAVGGKAMLFNAQVRLLNAITGERISSLQSHETTIESIAYSPDGRWLAAGSRYKPVQLTRLADGKMFSLPSERRNRTLSFSADSKLLAVGATSRHVDIWPVDQDTPGKPHEVSGFADGKPYIVQFAPNRSLLATGYTTAHWISLFDQPGNVRRGLAMEATAHSRSARFKSLGFSPQAQFLAAGDEAGSIVFWKLSSDSDDNFPRIPPLTSFSPHQMTVSSVQFVDESSLISSGEDGSVCLTSPFASGAIHLRWSGVAVSDAVVAGDDIFLGCDDGTIRRISCDIFDQRTHHWPLLYRENAVAQVDVPEIHAQGSAAVSCLDVSPDGTMIAVGTGQEGVLLYHRNSGELLRTVQENLQSDDTSVDDIEFSADGRLLAFIGRRDYVTVLELETEQQRWSHFVGNGSAIQFLDNDQLLAVAHADDELRILDVQNGQVVQSMAVVQAAAVDLSPNGKTLACGQGDGRLSIFDVAANAVETVPSHRKTLESVAFASNGRTVTSLDSAGYLRFVDVESAAVFGGLLLSDLPLTGIDRWNVLSGESWLAAIVSTTEKESETTSTTDLYFWSFEYPKKTVFPAPE